MPDYRSEAQKEKDEREAKLAARKARIHDRALHHLNLALQLQTEEAISIEADALIRAGRSLQRLRGGSDREDDQ